MVSIIVPVYNVEDYIDKCISSLVNQTFMDIEIILIDDGSTDKSGDICIKWQKKDDRIIYLRKKNEGQGVARNIGVEISSGKYITFVDSDDWIEHEAIECMYNAAEKSSADIVVCDLNYVVKDENNNITINTSRLRVDSEVVIDAKKDIKLIDKARLFCCAKLYNRKFYINTKVKQINHAFEDTAVLPFLIYKANKIYRIPKALYNYYRGRTDSTVNIVNNYGDMLKSLQEIEKGFKEEGVFEKYYTVLKKVSYSQVRFIYKKLSAAGRKVFLDNKEIINELYEFMDRVYPDWVNIDEYSIGIIGEENLKKSVENISIDSSKVESVKHDSEKLINKDILIINLVNNLIGDDIKLWIQQSRNALEYLQENFKGKQVIVVKFINENYRKQSKVIDEIYAEYKKSNLNVSVIEQCGDDSVYDENMSWDLSDEILENLTR